MATAPLARDLATVGPFRDLDEASRSVVAKWFETQSYEPGEIVVGENDGKAFFVIASGTASVSIGDDNFALLEAGDYFGEMSILYAEHRAGTVVAVTPLSVWSMFGTRHQEMAYA